MSMFKIQCEKLKELTKILLLKEALGTTEMYRGFNTLTTLPEEPGSVPRTHKLAHSHL